MVTITYPALSRVSAARQVSGTFRCYYGWVGFEWTEIVGKGKAQEGRQRAKGKHKRAVQNNLAHQYRSELLKIPF